LSLQAAGDQVGERRLAEARRAGEQDVVQGFAALDRRPDRQRQVGADRVLSDELGEAAGPQGTVERRLVDTWFLVEDHEESGSGRPGRAAAVGPPLRLARCDRRSGHTSEAGAPERRRGWTYPPGPAAPCRRAFGEPAGRSGR